MYAPGRMADLPAPSLGLAALLPQLRRRAGLTQAALAASLGCSIPTVQRLDAGGGSANLRRLFELADGLDTTATALACLINGARERVGDRKELRAWLDGLDWQGEVARPRLAGDGGVAAPAPFTPAQDPEGRRRSRVFGRLIPILCLRAGLSREQLAVAWGPSASSIKRFSAGATSPELDALVDLGRVLGLDWAEIVALTERVAGAVPLEAISARLHPGVVDHVRHWVERRARWVPNPGIGLLASRPAGIRFELVERGAEAPAEEAVGEESGALYRMRNDSAELLIAAEPNASFGAPRRAAYREAVVEPAAAALLARLNQGWGALCARIVPEAGPGGDGAGAIAAELARLLAHEGSAVRDVLLLRRTRGGGVPPAPPRKADEDVVETIAARSALGRVALRAAEGDPYRLVVADGLDALAAAGLSGRQPSPALLGAALAVIDDELTRTHKDLRQLTDRPLDWEIPWIQAMDEGLVAGLRFVGVVDPAATPSDKGYLRWAGDRQDDDEDLGWLDDRRLEALAAAGAFRPGVNTVVITRSASEVVWVEGWVTRHRGSQGRLVAVHGSDKRASWDTSIDELVLLDKSFPKMLVRQIARALPLADRARGLDVWEMEPGYRPSAFKRRASLEAALGVPVRATKASRGRWRSKGGKCSFRWSAAKGVAGPAAAEEGPDSLA
jgi:transcriptional regulator with XRE-family HTH domain